MNSIVIAASITGPMTSKSQEQMAPAQAKIGRRRQAMPGARMFRIVVVRSIAKRTKPRVARPVAEAQASTPSLGRKASSESGASGLTPGLRGREEKTRIEHRRTGDHQPSADLAEPRQCRPASADLQWHQVIEEAEGTAGSRRRRSRSPRKARASG